MADKVVSKNGLPIRMQDMGDGTYAEQTVTKGSLAKGPDGNDFVIEGTNCKGKSTSKPLASAYPFYTYWSVDTDPSGNAVEVSNGTAWVVM